MTSERRKRVWQRGCLSMALATAVLGLAQPGCTHIPWSWKSPWAVDVTSSGTPNTLAARIAEVQAAAAGVEDLSAAQQQQVSARMVQTFRKDSHPAVRKAIAEGLGQFRTPAAREGLELALRDPDREVRIAACVSLAEWDSPESFRLLAETIRSDTDVDVRLAATRCLGGSPHPAAVGALSSALDDSDPAVQYVAMQALRQSTGKNPGTDLAEWKRIAREISPARASDGGVSEEGSKWR